MKFEKASNSVRVFLLVIGVVISLGIWLTGVDVVHWLLFVPAVFLIFAAITGICPGLIFTKALFGGKE